MKEICRNIILSIIVIIFHQYNMYSDSEQLIKRPNKMEEEKKKSKNRRKKHRWVKKDKCSDANCRGQRVEIEGADTGGEKTDEKGEYKDSGRAVGIHGGK